MRQENNPRPSSSSGTQHFEALPRRRPFKRGLISFSTEDKDIFFGREREIENLANTVNEERIVIVIGPSGCGKTSLINAGLIPKLRQMNYSVVYSFVLERITKDVLRAINDELESTDREPANTLQNGLENLYLGASSNQTAVRSTPASIESELADLRSKLEEHFSEDDIQNLCFDLNVDFEALPGSSKPSKVRELIVYLKRRGDLQRLINKCAEQRPNLIWIYSDQATDKSNINPAGIKYENRANRPIVLIVDQFEKALHTSHDTKDLESFLKDAVFLLKTNRQLVKLIVVVRSDWLSYLAMEVRSLQLDLRVYGLTYLVDYLSRDAARAAIIRPLSAMQVPYDDKVVEDILDSLLGYSHEASIEKRYIQPTQLQLVVDSLCSFAEQTGELERAFSWDNYKASGGVSSIITSYLSRTLAGRPDAWRLLSRFVSNDSRSNRSLPYSELLAIPAVNEVDAEIQELVKSGLVQVYEIDKGVKYCRLAHDYIGEAVMVYLRDNPDQQGWKLAEDWLARATDEWAPPNSPADSEPPLLDRNRYLHIYEYRDKLNLGDASRGLLIQSALRNGERGLDYWLSRGPVTDNELSIVTHELCSVQAERQKPARLALARSTLTDRQNSASSLRKDLPNEGVSEAARAKLHARLIRIFDESRLVAKPRRESSARALWTLQAFDGLKEQGRVAPVVLGRWARDNARMIALYLLTGIVILSLALGIFYLRGQVAGTWETSYALKAGWVPVLATNVYNPDEVLALTVGGPAPGDGASLYALKEGKWNLRSRNIVRAQPTALVSVPNRNGGQTLVASFFASGIRRSDDNGRTWYSSNAGLPSLALTSLAADIGNPGVVFVSSSDWGGVMRSHDSGASWEPFDASDEDIRGAAITKLAVTRAGNGTLIAGTTDGRLLAKRLSGNGDGWNSAFPVFEDTVRGGIRALVVAPSDDQVIYAGTERGFILLSLDGGNSFERLGRISTGGFEISALLVDATNSRRLFASVYGNGGHTLWESTDEGVSWKPSRANDGLPRTITSALIATKNETEFFAGTGDGLFSSSDSGRNWHRVGITAPLASISALAVSPGVSKPIYASVSGSIYANPSGNLKDWKLGEGLNAQIVRTIVADPTEPDTAYAGVLLLGQWSVFITTNGGLTWTTTISPANFNSVVPDTVDIAVTKGRDDQTILYTAATGCGVIRSSDGGKTWDVYGRKSCSDIRDPNAPADVKSIAVSPKNPDLVYAATGKTLFLSNNGGSSWSSQDLPITGSIRDIVADPHDTSAAYLITLSDGVLRSRDAGKTWAPAGANYFAEVQPTDLLVDPGALGKLVVGTASGDILLSRDYGDTWVSIRENLSIEGTTSIVSIGDAGEITVSTLWNGLARFQPNPLYEIIHR